MIGISNRRVLVVGRDYFFYTREIVTELSTAFGAEAVFVPIAPETNWYRVLKRIPGAAGRWLAWFHRRRVARLSSERFDIVLFIQVHQLSEALLLLYKATFPSARFILYYWDSLATHDYRDYLVHFDETWTFDPSDARSDPRLKLLPAFFCERFKKLRNVATFQYDLAFVGTAMNLARYDRVQEFRQWAIQGGLRFYDYLYVSPLFYLRAFVGGTRLRGVHFRPLSEERLVRIYEGARAVLDLPNNTQAGYTMRTFESLGAYRKLVTTKQEIVGEDFFDAASVFVIGPDGDFPSRAFLRS